MSSKSAFHLFYFCRFIDKIMHFGVNSQGWSGYLKQQYILPQPTQSPSLPKSLKTELTTQEWSLKFISASDRNWDILFYFVFLIIFFARTKQIIVLPIYVVTILVHFQTMYEKSYIVLLLTISLHTCTIRPKKKVFVCPNTTDPKTEKHHTLFFFF